MSTLLIRNIKGLVQAERQPRAEARGAAMADLPVLENAFLLAENGLIQDFGPMSTCPERADEILDATGRYVLPGWCDSHTHLIFAASREGEFVQRIRGASYEEIAQQGGGILNSARRLQDCPEDDLLESAWRRLQEVIALGTAAIEIKSGYGLSTESELKMLRVARRLREISPIPIKTTFLGAHALPAAYKTNRTAYVDLLIQEMLPRIAEEGLADYCDVFCERGFFTVEETDRILKAAWAFGLKPKIHANQLDYSGGVQVGLANNAVSVDHLEHCGDAEIEALLHGQTMPTLLPSCSFFIGIPYAPARQLIDAGLPVALASDYNPGSTPSGNMQFVVSLACIQMKMLPEEAIQAATRNGARALELERALGTITPGKIAHFMITKPIPSLAFLPYSFGSQLVDSVVLSGKPYTKNRQ